MIELYQSVISGIRSPERTDALLRLVTILQSAEYADDLVRIEDYLATSDNQTDTALLVECLLVDCTYSLLNKIGVSITKEHINQSPNTVADILTVILEDVDSFDDYDTMLQIVQHELNPVEAIGCLVAFVIHAQEHTYIELIESVTQGTLNTLRDILTVRAIQDLDANSARDLGLVRQLTHFVRERDDSVVTPLLLEEGYLNSATTIADKLVIPETGNIVGQYASSIAGILFTRHLTFDAAYEHLEYLTEYIIGDNTHVDPKQVLVNAADILSQLFKTLGAGDE